MPGRHVVPLTYLPDNPMEHDGKLRNLIGRHMGLGDGNPTQWVVDAMHDAYQLGFADALKAVGKKPQATATVHPYPPAPPATRIDIERPRLADDSIIDV